LSETVVLAKEKWYEKLLQDLKKLIRSEDLTLIRFKHEMGRRILQERHNIPWGQKLQFIKALANDLNYSWQDLYFSMKFAEKYPDFDEFESKFLTPLEKFSWRRIVRDLLYEKLPEEAQAVAYVYTHEDWTCPVCRAVYKLMHGGPDKHKIELVEEGREGALREEE